ncbi:MAG: bifunctional glutamate N-acetyltransferase/amino-acid acetyltransferase ArgJ [Actinomycetota bacterium]
MSVTAAAGFEAAGIASGIKPDGVPDLALVSTADRRPVTAAGVFTTNLATAAPVQISRRHLEDGQAAAVILSSGNANAATGEPGRRDARRMCELTARELGCGPDDVLVCSTGLIGIPLPMDPIESGIPKLVGSLGSDSSAGEAAADAMLTTDTVRKESEVPLDLSGATATVGGMAKGAAMLAPAMATMLAVLTTDAAVTPDALHGALSRAVADTFNSLIVDGCTSTNDTVLAFAGAGAGNDPIVESGPGFAALEASLTSVCAHLAGQMAADAEGATKRAIVVVRGARSGEDAQLAARAVASSQLVQCSLNGGDPYWGRVLSELGASGAVFDPERTDIAYNDITVCRDGIATNHDAGALERAMSGSEIEIACDLNAGNSQVTVLFTDLSHAYIDENRGTS